MRAPLPVSSLALLPLMTVVSCGQLAVHESLFATMPSEGRTSRAQDRQHIDDYEPPRGRPYSSTRARLQLFREDVELDDIDVDIDNAAGFSLRDFGRERTGFRGEFGQGQVGGFFQLFREDTESRALFGPDVQSYGIGGGVVGAPAVGRAGPVEFAVPLRVGINMVLGDEDTGIYDQDLFYLQSRFEVGFAARIFGLQASSGLVADSIAGAFDSEDPSNLAGSGTADLSGTNFGLYFEALYKHPQVPLIASARAVVGDVQGLAFTFGLAF